MIYVLNGDETYQMAKRKQELLDKNDLSSDDIVSFDLNEPQSIVPVLNACNTVSLFSDQRAIVVHDPFFLNPKGKSSKKNVDADICKLLEPYLQQPNPDTDLIFYCFGFKMDNRKRETKLFKKYDGKSVRILNYYNPTPYELDRLIDQELAKHHLHLNREAREEFRLRINDSATEMYRAIDKLELYGQSNFTLEDIQHLVSINADINIWKFQDAFLAKDARGTYRSIYEMLELSSMTPQSIIPLMSFRLKQVFLVVRCYENGMNFQQIKAKTKRFYPDKDYRSAHGRSSRELLAIIDDLATLDQGIKRGVIDSQAGLDYFLLKHLQK